MRHRFYETESRGYSTSTPLVEIRPEKIQVLSTSVSTMRYYQRQMSKAVWRPAAGRKLGFLVVHENSLLGLIFLASPVRRLAARDNFLFPNAPVHFDYGTALRNYMDLSVCVAAQPIGWHWNLGKLLAMIAPTLGDYVEARYGDPLNGVTTTSIFGGLKATQYTRVYKHLGETKGFGHEHISDEEYERMCDWLRHLGRLPSASFRAGATNSRMDRIRLYFKLSGERGGLRHGHQRGVYYHAAIPPERRPEIIQQWHTRWGLPRYERTKNSEAPYSTGREEPVLMRTAA